MRSLFDYILLYLKGLSMGAADVVPGVSGGTIAFITGIYKELLDSISAFNLKALKILFKEGIIAFWKHINGNFLVVLFGGIFSSILLLVKFITESLESHPIQVWSFFFGLILASIPFMAKQIRPWTISNWIALFVGTIIAYTITILPTFNPNNSEWFIFLSGCIAICAMILPGISGSFILLLLGSYQIILKAADDREITTLIIFAAGCGIGLLAFSRLLKWLFEHRKNITLAILTGFLIGSLNKIWPWKETIKSVSVKGKTHILEARNILPENNNEIINALIFLTMGFVLVYTLERLAFNKNTKK